MMMSSSMSGQFSLMRRRVVGLCSGVRSVSSVSYVRAVKVMNVPFDATRETILSALSDKGIEPRSVELVFRTNQRFNGIARLKFDSTDQAKEVLVRKQFYVVYVILTVWLGHQGDSDD
jgi:hypothetical protein